MEVRENKPPRRFTVRGGIELSHTADIELEPDEQVTLVTTSDTGDGTELDVVRKSWGYYAMPSLNRRLPAHGLRPALTQGENGKMFIHMCEHDRVEEFEAYLAGDDMWVVAWLDSDEAVAEAVSRLRSDAP